MKAAIVAYFLDLEARLAVLSCLLLLFLLHGHVNVHISHYPRSLTGKFVCGLRYADEAVWTMENKSKARPKAVEAKACCLTAAYDPNNAYAVRQLPSRFDIGLIPSSVIVSSALTRPSTMSSGSSTSPDWLFAQDFVGDFKSRTSGTFCLMTVGRIANIHRAVP